MVPGLRAQFLRAAFADIRAIDRSGRETDLVADGRQDLRLEVCTRSVGEAMMACMRADRFLRHRGQMG